MPSGRSPCCLGGAWPWDGSFQVAGLAMSWIVGVADRPACVEGGSVGGGQRDAASRPSGQVGVGDERLAEGGHIDQTAGDESVARVWCDPDICDQSAVEQRPV